MCVCVYTSICVFVLYVCMWACVYTHTNNVISRATTKKLCKELYSKILQTNKNEISRDIWKGKIK